ncbi:MAG TPA: PD-(D/E)XK nuclease family protein [Solirubrobacteraceae bacterium]|nr:PD-(D/E)XK nuclease family protein [Solirubrobacteraceae bacterium]
MPLTLVLGPANSAKAGEVFAAYEAAARRGALLVVPHARDAEHYSRELAADGAVLGSVVTFAGLVAEIARRAGYRPLTLTQLQRELVLARAIARAGLSVLGPAAETPGFGDAALELVTELERSLVTPQRFTAAMERWADEDPRRGAYAREVAGIYAAYTAELERLGLVDPELFAWRALDALRRSPESWGEDAVFFYGFDDLHGLERDAVETLARVVQAEVMVALPYEAGRSALAARAEVVEELRPLAERVIDLPPVAEYYGPRSRAVLHHLERFLFETDPGPRAAPGEAVVLLEGAGARAEAELVAADVLELLRGGVAPDEIAVIHRSLAAAAPVLAEVFAAYGIPAAVTRRVGFAHTPLGRGLVGLARCALLPVGEATAQDLIDFLRTPGLLERAEVTDALELEVRRGGLTTAEEARERLSFGVDEIDAVRDARHPGAELVRVARRLQAGPHRRQAAVLDDPEAVDARALSVLMGALGEVQELGGELPRHELLELLERLEVPVSAGAATGTIVVSEPLAVRARRFRAVFICGLQEGEFPRPGRPEPFFSDERRRELASLTGLRLRLSEDSLAAERYLFYAAVSRATERLVLSYCSSDEEGNLQLPSPFVADVADLLEPSWASNRRRRLLGDVVWPVEAAPTARERERSLAAASAPAAGGALAPELDLSERALAQVRHTRVLSAGALEQFASCPVKWLVERELQPAELGGESEAIVRGSYMHDMLEQVLLGLGEAVTSETLPDALRILDDLVQELPPQLAPGRPEGLRRATLEAIAADLRRYLEWEASHGCGWEPRWLELRFGFEGEEGALPPFELGEGGERISLRGAIDRIDVGPDGRTAVIRDYKSGGTRPEHQAARWRVDGTLQVALYMLAARALLDVEPVAGLYQPLGGRDLRARGVFVEGAPVSGECVANDGRDPAGLEAELNDAAARALELAGRLRSGQISPCPQTCSRQGCRYPGICRVS